MSNVLDALLTITLMGFKIFFFVFLLISFKKKMIFWIFLFHSFLFSTKNSEFWFVFLFFDGSVFDLNHKSTKKKEIKKFYWNKKKRRKRKIKNQTKILVETKDQALYALYSLKFLDIHSVQWGWIWKFVNNYLSKFKKKWKIKSCNSNSLCVNSHKLSTIK